MLRGLPLAIQLGLIFLHWWWVLVLIQPVDAIHFYPSFREFAAIGGHDYWLHRAVVVAVLASLSPFRIPIVMREIIIGIQASWLVILTVLFTLDFPLVTGPGAYAVFAYLALCLAVVCWRSRGDELGR